MAEVRQLKIKTGSVLRLSKELGMYAAEQATEAARVAKMRDDDRDSHDIQHAVKAYGPPLSFVTWICRLHLLHSIFQTATHSGAYSQLESLQRSLRRRTSG